MTNYEIYQACIVYRVRKFDFLSHGSYDLQSAFSELERVT